MEEEIKEEERSADEARKHGNDVVVDEDDDPWVKQMEEKLASKSKQCQPSHPFTICKVPRDIRGVDDAAHNPLVVSIGPYHRGDPNLRDMEQVKWRNLNAFRGRAGKDFNKYLKALKEIEPRVRDCYSGNIDMVADEFIEMMLLDGLFMIELFSPTGKSFLFVLLRFLSIDKEEPIYTISGMSCRVGHDMLLLENQLPFFVLECLWNLIDQRSRFDLWNSACTFILDLSLPFQHKWDLDLLKVIFDEEEKKKENSEMTNEDGVHHLLQVIFDEEEEEKENPEMTNEDGVHHLLHLVYLLLQPTSLTSTKKSKPEPTSGSSSESLEPTAKLPAFIKKMKTLSFLPPRCRDCFPSPSGQESQSMKCTVKLPAFIKKMKTLSFLPPRCHSFPSPSACQKSQFMECTKKLSAFIKKILPFLSPSKSQEEQPPPLAVIPCAAELDESGVEFQCVKAQSFLDVKFEQGTMKMPRLSVQDSTKSLLRNFIAYEQCFPSRGSHFTSYCCFMDYLVNTPGDVEILKRSAIIENRLGNDEEVALLFNDLGKGIFLSDLGESYLGKSYKDVMKHTQKTWPKWRARLKHDYFSNPWAIISLIAATFVIFLTSVQTYKAAFP